MRMLRAQLKAAPKQAKLLGALTFVFLVALIRMIFTLGPDATEAAPPPILPVAGAQAPAPQPVPVRPEIVRQPLPELPDQAVRDLFAASWLRNDRQPLPEPKPVITEPPAAVVVDTPPLEFVLELTLTGAADNGQHCAIINGKRLHVGESIDGFVVKTIAPGLVVLMGNQGEQVVVRMN